MEQVKLPNYSYVTIFKMNKNEIDKIDFCLCKQPKETLETFYERQPNKPDLLVNGGFFSMATGDTIFTFVDESQIISKENTLLDGMGVRGNNELYAGTYDSSYRDFISGYPVLIKNGEAFSTSIGSEIDYAARRSVLAYDDNYVYLIAVDAPGLNFSKLKSLLLSLGIKEAINLDGGGSTRILKDGKRITSTVYSRPVDNVVAFYLKKEASSPTIIYRVQTGAFSKKENAERYQQTIRSLEDSIGAGYKNAYVRLIDNLYKVQVGAFSKKENAERVVADLKAKGYNSFITTK